MVMVIVIVSAMGYAHDYRLGLMVGLVLGLWVCLVNG